MSLPAEQPSKRAERIQSPSIVLPFRSPDGALSSCDVWREDILEWRPDDRFPSTYYLVIDFGVEQILTVIADTESTYVDTGRIQLDIQPIMVPSTPEEWHQSPDREGFGPPVARFADVPTDELGDRPRDEPITGRPMVGWVPHPVSPRR